MSKKIPDFKPEIILVPQCSDCKKNIDLTTCEQFKKGKPEGYVNNAITCEHKEQE